MMEKEHNAFKANDSNQDLFDINKVDAVSIGNNWHQIVPGTVAFSLDTEDTWWLSASLVPNTTVGDTPTHTAWFSSYEISGYRVLDQ
jgi:hypothetical protein